MEALRGGLLRLAHIGFRTLAAWECGGAKFGPEAESALASKIDEKSLEQLRPQIEALHQAYVDVKPGDRYALTFLLAKERSSPRTERGWL